MKTIFLCGFMGCGKSTVGKLLAKNLGKAFIDMDDYVEKSEGMSIPEIFEKHGEAYFRNAETKALEKLCENGGVVATGGGALLSDVNADIAKKNGIVCFIDVAFEVCYERISGDQNRPIAASSTKEQLRDRFEYRKPIYIKNSTFTICGDGTPTELAQKIITELKTIGCKR